MIGQNNFWMKEVKKQSQEYLYLYLRTAMQIPFAIFFTVI